MENTETVKNMNVKPRYRLTRRLGTANNMSIRSEITNFCTPTHEVGSEVEEHDGPCRKLPVTCGHLAQFGCSYMSSIVGACWGPKN